MKQGDTYWSYTVGPFSQKAAHKLLDAAWGRAGKAEREDPTKRFLDCGICCRPVDANKVKTFGIVIDGGSDWGDKDSPDDAGYMGAFPIGPDCHRKFKLEKRGEEPADEG